MKERAFLTTPVAVIVGSVLISLTILISGGIVKFGKPAAQTTANTTAQPAAAQPTAQPQVSLSQVKDAFNKAQIKFGDNNKKLVSIEIADPSCPYCHAAAGRNGDLNKQMGSQFTLVADGGSYVAPVPELEKLVKSGQVAFAYIYYPGHGNGEMGAKALYCANEKGKFWEVHDLLMSSKGYDLLNTTVKNDKTKSQDVADFLSSVFDSGAMKSCLDSGKYDNQLNADKAIATSLGVQGTPGFFLNSTEYSGAYNYTDMEQTVQSALGS